MTTTKTKPEFAELTDEQLTYIECVQIGRMFVTNEQAEEIAKVLGLEGMTRDELTAVRNSVVKHLGGFASIARMCENAKSYEHYQNAMSGIVTVIDHAIFCTAA